MDGNVQIWDPVKDEVFDTLRLGLCVNALAWLRGTLVVRSDGGTRAEVVFPA